MAPIDRRSFARLTLAAAAGAAMAPRDARAQAALEDAAAKEGTVAWYNGYMGDTAAQEMVGKFQELHPRVKVTALRSTSQVAYQRLLQDRQAGLHNCDVYSSSDISHFDTMKRENRLLAYTPANAAKIYPAFGALYEPGFYYPALISMLVLGWNTKQVTAADAPKSWQDLLNPRWKGKLAMGHPGFSGYSGTWALLMQQMYGDGFFEKLAKNNPLIGRSANDAVTQLNSGECIVAAAPAYVAIESLRRGNPVAIGYPTDGALLMCSPAAIVADAPHPSAAKLFMEFLLGPENSRILVKQGAESLNTDVTPAADQRPIAEVKTARPALKDIVSGIPQVTEVWRDALGG